MVVPNLDQVMDYYIASGQGDRDPYWCDIWPAAVAVAGHLKSMNLSGRSVVDLGCGLGLAGIVAALQGASSVLLLDQEPMALQCALLSAQLNGVGAVHGQGALSTFDPVARGLVPKGASATALGHSPAAGALSAAVFDWNADPAPAPVDVVLACDVLYEASYVEPLMDLLPRLLAAPASQLVLADPVKRTPAHRRQLLQGLISCSDADLALMERWEVSAQACDPPSSEIQVLVLQGRQPGDTLGLSLD